jgi:hypothetical protein
MNATKFGRFLTTRTLVRIAAFLSALLILRGVASHYEFSWLSALSQDWN